MRFTIERIRTLVIATGVLLLAAIIVFLAVGRWKNPFNRRDIPKRLGIDIEQEANGVTYTQSHAGHTLFKIHASKVVQLKNSHATLHDVQIELYGEDGSRVDRIAGDEFDYDQKGGVATAAGPVEITLMRPGVKPAIASAPAEAGGDKARASQRTMQKGSSPGAKEASSAPGASADTKGQIDVKTSGLVFNQQTGVATTTKLVNFSSAQGSGSSIGASYDSQNGFLALDSEVEMTTRPSAAGGPSREPVEMRAAHAEFKRDTPVCRLHQATAKTKGEQVTATDATLFFRDDGSITELDAVNGLTVATDAGGRLAAPTGTMKFNESNHPQSGHLEGGVTLDSISGDSASGSSTTGSRVMHGSSSTMDLGFTDAGDLRHAHMQQAVEMHSRELSQSISNGKPVALEVNRTWRSSVADVEFRKGEKGQLEPAAVHGVGGVVITGETRRADEPAAPSKLAADDVSGEFGPASALKSMIGTGHASMEETAANGAHETAAGDRLEAHFFDAQGSPNQTTVAAAQKSAAAQGAGTNAPGGAQQIQTAVLDGHVVLIQQPAPQPIQQSNTHTGSQQPLRATAGKAEYDGEGQLLHLTINPRVENGGLQLTADKVDVAQASSEAFAHGDVKATWTGNDTDGSSGSMGAAPAASGISGSGLSNPGSGLHDPGLGGKGPAHAIAAEAELHQATGEATFRGHARLWQDTNSVTGPTIVLDREKQTLTATSADPAEPVRVVMLSAGSPAANIAQPATQAQAANAGNGANGKSSAPSVIRVRGGDLWYSGLERRALMKGGALGPVTVETGGVESTSNQVELFLVSAGDSGNRGAQPQPGPAQSQVDHMTASGHVVLASQDRRGTGEQLAYTARTGDYVLTGTAAALPRMSDPARGTVTGETLIFHSRDDSVNVEGGGQKTRTDTTAPR